MTRPLAFVLAVALAGGLILFTARNAAPVRAARYYLRGQSSCGFAESVDAVRLFQEQLAATRKVLSASRVIDHDGALNLWATPYGTWWAPATSTSGLAYVLAEQSREAYGDEVKPGDTVLDCGANVGSFTRKALAKGARMVVAIEPVPANVECLRRNFAREIIEGRVVVYPKGVWDSTEVLTMWVYNESALDSFLMNNRPEEAKKPSQVFLPVTTIDHIVAELGLTRVDAIKMDVEGAERRALAGARHTLRGFRPRLTIATENLPDDQYVVPQLVKQAAQPPYQIRRGACMLLQFGQIAPEVLEFR